MIRNLPQRPQPPPQRQGRGGLGFVLLVSGALLLLPLGLCVIYLWQRSGPAAGQIQVTLGAVRLAFDARYARFLPGRAGGQLDQVDLAAHFPDFAPAGEINGLSPSSDMAARHELQVFLTLTPIAKGLDPAERVSKLYARFLEEEEWSHPGGLVMRRFAAGSPFANEDLYLTPPEGKLFAARCARPASQPDGLPDTCLHEFRLGGLNVQLRFSPARLADWDAMTEGARQLVARMLRQA